MRILTTLFSSLIIASLAVPITAYADAKDVPQSADWYFFIDLKQMKTSPAGNGLYRWLQDEVFDDVKNDVGVDLDKELDRITSYAIDGGGTVVFEGKVSQETNDKLMAIIAAGGDIQPLKASGNTYFHVGGNVDTDEDISYNSGKVSFDIESLGDEAWISMALKNKILVTSSETHMKTLLANKGKVPRARDHNGALLVLSAEKALLQAGLDADALGEDDDGDWSSNIFRNTEKAALLIAAQADKLIIEAELLTTEAEMAESLASVARGLISLMSFDDDMDAEMIDVLRGTTVAAKGNRLKLSLAVSSELVVAALSD